MAEQTFRSPGFFEQEIDLSARKVAPFGTPAGVIGTAEKGPAFVPVTVGSFADFNTKFGSLNSDRFGPYAVNEFLKNRTSLTYLRILGAGANDSVSNIETTINQGTVKNAGFRLVSADADKTGAGSSGEHVGAVQFLVAVHDAVTNQALGFPVLTDNDSIASADSATLVRAVVLMASGTRMQLLGATGSYVDLNTAATLNKGSVTPGTIDGSALTDASKYFKIVLSSSAGASFGNSEKNAGIRILSASLDPRSAHYVSKILNTDPLKFQSEEHLLYLDLPVAHELAPIISTGESVALLSGSANTTAAGGDTSTAFRDLFGRFDTRYTTPKTTAFISQPYGTKEYSLFHFESLSDGAYANDKFKVSIANLRASTDPNDKYGTFEVQLRTFDDSDTNTAIIEAYPNITLDPNSERYIARVIGDKKVYYDFDQEDPDERRLIVQGKYPNVSQRIRVIMNSGLEDGEVPQTALPFGFRGLPVIKTTDSLTDVATTGLIDGRNATIGNNESRRLSAVGLNLTAGIPTSTAHAGTSPVFPPVPFRFKVTRGDVSTTGYRGQPGNDERVDGRFYWGIKFDRIEESTVVDNPVLNANIAQGINPLIKSYTKFQGIEKLDTLVTGTATDEYNNNKFTLARVAFSNGGTALSAVFSAMTGTAREHMKEAAYIRNGKPDGNRYTIIDPSTAVSRYTLASLVHTSSTLFNRFTGFAKYTNVFYGGFDGVNILDKDASLFRDKAFSADTGGKAIDGDPDVGLAQVSSNNQMGEGRLANSNMSVRRAVDIMTDPWATQINILAIPGVRDSFVTDHALIKTKEYSKAIYVMDTLKYDEENTRLYDDSTARVDVRQTSENFESRAIDNNYGATFFPDVYIDDHVNNQIVKVPSSVAALGTLGFNDRVAYPWFAPAGFNRGGLDFVRNVENRLTAGDRDTLYDARINPIAVFPNTGFVIFGQKTLQFAKSALDRVNVRRLLLEVKRQVVGVAERILFEPNTPVTRARFVSQVTPLLALIQAQAGLEQFKVIMDDTNNSQIDVETNKLNGRIVIVPTRAVEFIAIDFIITNAGVSFE
jgi:hypothetical protein